jgi:two-component system, chemotaxis family, chemotaxis protein CheY
MLTAHPPGKKVLVVEDDFLLREALSMVLAGEGYQVPTAADGQQGLVRLHDHERPDVILLDLMLPGMDGWEFRRRQQQDPAVASIPVIVLSAMPNVSEEATSLGAAGCLQKPVESRQIVDAVRGCCPTAP